LAADGMADAEGASLSWNGVSITSEDNAGIKG
jgi:hypothetical protein